MVVTLKSAHIIRLECDIAESEVRMRSAELDRLTSCHVDSAANIDISSLPSDWIPEILLLVSISDSVVGDVFVKE